ncbi:MAG: SlyX family protein [bacterium]|nr:SlyX family protein [bacterium]
MSLKSKALKQADNQQIRKQQREIDALKRKIEILDQANQDLEESLAKARSSRIKLPTQGKTRTSKGAFIRFFVPDSHGAHVDEAALKAMLADIEYLKPRQVVFMGDHLDCGGFLAQHQTLGFVAETEASFEDDVNAANQFLDSVQSLCPNAEMHYLIGNHEERIEKFIITQTLRHGRDAAFLMRLWGPAAVLNLESRGIPFYNKSETYAGCRVQGTIKLGHVFATHGTRHGKNAAAQMLNRFGANVVFGHVHKLLSFGDRNVRDGEMGAWSVGHISRQQPLWRHGDPTDWTQGYGFQIVQPSEDFLHINVPIIDGKSYLSSLGKLIS